jgi:hypothetical protein
MENDTRKRFMDIMASERQKQAQAFGNAGSLNNLMSRAVSAMSAREPESRRVMTEDLGFLSAEEVAAGGV